MRVAQVERTQADALLSTRSREPTPTPYVDVRTDDVAVEMGHEARRRR